MEWVEGSGRIDSSRSRPVRPGRRLGAAILCRQSLTVFQESGSPAKTWAAARISRARIGSPASARAWMTCRVSKLRTDTENEAIYRWNRILALHREAATSPCAGVYAVVEAAGSVRTGDRVTLD
jgi:hypothetical protein